MASPAVTELEMLVMDWLGKLVNLPEVFLYSSNGKGGGVCQTTTSESNLIGLLAARAKKLNELNIEHPEWDEGHILPRLTAYTSEQAHSSAVRAGLLGGVKMKCITANSDNILTYEIVKKQIEEDLEKGLIPFYVSNPYQCYNNCKF